MKTLLIIFSLIIFQSAAYTQKGIDYGILKTPSEKIIFSFKLKNSNKIITLCAGKDNQYLVYRFGNKDKVELQYPGFLNAASWKLFHYSGYSRGGGIKNDATEQHSLSFVNNKITYKMYDDWDSEKNKEEIFVTVMINGKESKIIGDANSKVGSLGLLRGKENLIHNYYQDENQ